MGSLSRLVLPQHEQFYPDVLSVFVGLDKVSTEIQGLSSTYCNFQGLSRPWISFIKFKDFQGACEPWENLVLHFSRSLVRLVTPKTRHFTYHYWVKLNTTLLRIFLLRWCYTGRFATAMFCATPRCNVGTLLQRPDSKQCCNNVEMICCLKNRRCKSSRVT